MPSELVVEKFTVGPFQENTFLVGCGVTRQAVFIDPGDEADRLAAAVEDAGLTLIGILNTHAHIDHIGAVQELKERFGVPFALHPDDEFLLDQARLHAALFGVRAPPRPAVDRYLVPGEQIPVGQRLFRVLFVPGHAPGHVAFATEGHVFSGDTLFAGSIGRTDLPGGDYETLIRSIREELLPLGDDIEVHPGHMEDTTIGRERRSNPFLVDGGVVWR